MVCAAFHEQEGSPRQALSEAESGSGPTATFQLRRLGGDHEPGRKCPRSDRRRPSLRADVAGSSPPFPCGTSNVAGPRGNPTQGSDLRRSRIAAPSAVHSENRLCDRLPTPGQLAYASVMVAADLIRTRIFLSPLQILFLTRDSR